MARKFFVLAPVLLVLAGVGMAAWAQDVGPMQAEGDALSINIPQYVLTTLATGSFGWLIRSGGLPLRVTVTLDDRDRDLLRDLRDLIREIASRRGE